MWSLLQLLVAMLLVSAHSCWSQAQVRGPQLLQTDRHQSHTSLDLLFRSPALGLLPGQKPLYWATPITQLWSPVWSLGLSTPASLVER